MIKPYLPSAVYVSTVEVTDTCAHPIENPNPNHSRPSSPPDPSAEVPITFALANDGAPPWGTVSHPHQSVRVPQAQGLASTALLENLEAVLGEA
jgi:hypothetical protein